MTGQRESPTFRKYHHHGSGFHGSPVDPRTKSDERSFARTGSSPERIRPRIAVGEIEHRADVRDIRPGDVAAAFRIRPAHAIDDDHGPDGWRAVRRLVGDLLHLDNLTATVEAVGADEDLRLGIAQPTGDRLRAV